MSPRHVIALLAVSGGIVWVLRWLLMEPGTTASGALYWAGLAGIAGALGVAGMHLVSAGAVAVRLVVALAFPLLVWSLVELVRPADALGFDALLGVLAMVWSTVALMVGEAASQTARARSASAAVPAPRRGGARVAPRTAERHRGSHAR